MRTMHVQVTQQDIDEGDKSQPRSCPLALAMTRAMGLPISVGGVGWSRLTKDGRFFDHKDLDLPVKAKLFINQYDLSKEVLPFEFVVGFKDEANN